jgi:hypothetical protein
MTGLIYEQMRIFIEIKHLTLPSLLARGVPANIT